MSQDNRSLAELFAGAPITAFLGWQLRVCEAGVAEVVLPHKPELVQGLGVVHGGVVAALADTAGFFAAASLAGASLATVEFKINLLAPVRADTLLSRASVVHRGRRLLVCQMNVVGADEAAVALAQGTYSIIQSQPAPAG